MAIVREAKMGKITKTEALRIAREAKSMYHPPGCEDTRIHDACERNGVAFPAHISADAETMGSIERIANGIMLHGTRAAKTNAERQAEFRERKKRSRLEEVRGIYAKPEDHAKIKAFAKSMQKPVDTVQKHS